jgi:hypothetical protein
VINTLYLFQIKLSFEISMYVVQITSQNHQMLTLCEVDVIGAKLNFSQSGEMLIISRVVTCG